MQTFSFSDNIEYHADLNPDIWEDGVIKTDVKYKLLKVAFEFIKFLDVDDFKLKDIVISGSNASFNWNKYSDFDIHVVTDYSDLECDVYAEKFYRAKKQLWNDNHNLQINGHDIEMYIEDTENTPVSEGIYSLLRDEWVSEPSYDPPSVDTDKVVKKAKYLNKMVKYAIKNYESSDELQRLLDKIYEYRKSGLEENGEYSVENLVFKILRNQGVIDTLRRSVSRVLDNEINF